ncbi:mitochondrial protein cyt-4 [Xylariaceae sp. FL0594]|nr:mitochondrial protein cyt-4 [Xylariaceae sp. FL0594]
MLQASKSSYVCWQCAARRLGPSSFTKSLSRRAFATVQDGRRYEDLGGHPGRRLTPFRVRLRQWEQLNKEPGEPMLPDLAEESQLSNSVTRPMNVSMLQVKPDDSSPLFLGDELIDLRSDDAMLNAGDLVELSAAGSRRPLLAVCLGRLHGIEHFYTVSGKWFAAVGINTLFVVHGFASQAELQPLIDDLSLDSRPAEAFNTLHDLGEGPSRATGAKLLRKMLQFAQDAETVYQDNVGTLDASSSFIGDPIKHRYLTLYEIASLLLPDKLRSRDRYPPHALYAVHRSLLQDEVFFRPLRHTGHRRSYLFEVSPLSEVQTIQKVDKIVRAYQVGLASRKPELPAPDSPLLSFVQKAQPIIDYSRKYQDELRKGKNRPKSKQPPKDPKWSQTDYDILHFIELWASYQKFPPHSRLQAVGSTILRALGRYEDFPGYLPSTGWTMLQEVGWIPSWEIPSRYSVRFPDVEIKRGGSYTRPFFGLLERHLKSDALASIRKPFKGTAFCIDDVTAGEIDDAVSIERTSKEGEYWIHVHVADPASSFSPDTPVAKYAELIPEAIYLPGHAEPMLPPNLIHERFSLAKDRPCLTFSALVNEDGIVLDEKIAPHTLGKVVYMTYEDAASVVDRPRVDPFKMTDQWAVGRVPKAKDATNRPMARPEELNDQEKEDLRKLAELGERTQAYRLRKGAIPIFRPRPMASVHFERTSKQQQPDGTAAAAAPAHFITSEKPAIRVQYSKMSATDLVENAMKLANEVAARWCYERGIPVPYRTQPHALRNAPAVQQLATTVLGPALVNGETPDENVWRQMRSLLGIDDVSTTPGPHFTLGSDMYTKATSPLRRFGDLVVHWQIEAALLEEKRLGRPLLKNRDKKDKKDNDLSFLPFPAHELDRMLPLLRLREKQARALTNVAGPEQWILQAMERAWRHGEAADVPLPKTFRLTVRVLQRTLAIGQLDWFDRSAVLRFGNLAPHAVSRDLRVGDVLEVEIDDIDVYSNRVFVRAVGRVQQQQEEDDNNSGIATAKDMDMDTDSGSVVA